MKDVNEVDDYVRLNPKTGMLEPVIWKREILPFALTVDEARNSNPIRVNGVGSTPPFIFKLPHASNNNMDQGRGNPLKIDRIVFVDRTTGNTNSVVTIMLKDMGDGAQFMNQPIPLKAFAALANLSAECFESLFLPSRHALMAEFAAVTLGGTPVDIYLYFWGGLHLCWSQTLAQYPLDRDIMFQRVDKLLNRRKQVYPFWLTTETVPTLGVNETGEYDMLIGNDGHFEASHWMAVMPDGADFEVKVYNPLTKQTLMNGTIQVTGSVGPSAEHPQPLAVPWFVEAGQRLRVQIKCLAGAASNTCKIVFRGRRIRAPLMELGKAVKQLNAEK